MRSPVNVREEASLESKILRVLQKGEAVEVIGFTKGFHKIKDGFVKEEFLE